MTHTPALVHGTVSDAIASSTFLSAIGLVANVRVPESLDSRATGPTSIALVVSSVLLSQADPMGALATSALGASGTLPIRVVVPTAPERANRRSL